MITYADFEFAIARWRARTAGVPMPTLQSVSGAVETAVPVSTEPDEAAPRVSDRPLQASGSIIISDSLSEPH